MAGRSAPAARLAVLLASLAGAVPAGGAPAGRMVTVAVYGDSVVEASDIPDSARDGLVPQLRAGLGRVGGLQLPGRGFVAASYSLWHFNAKTPPVGRAPAPNVWLLPGIVGPGPDGLSGYSAIATSAAASASTTVDARSIGLLFTRTAGSGVFTVNAGGRTFAVDAHTSGPPRPAERWITVPAGTSTIAVHGPRSGRLLFTGVIVRGRPTGGRIGVEVENLGHSGHYLDQDAAPRSIAAIGAQRFDISVLFAAYKRELDAAGGDAARSEAAYARELRARAALVRGYGGLCLIADPAPVPLPAAITERFAAIDRQVAADAGCAYTAALARLWNPATAVAAGMTIVDGVHPSARGYRLIARTLVPPLAGMVRERAGRS